MTLTCVRIHQHTVRMGSVHCLRVFVSMYVYGILYFPRMQYNVCAILKWNVVCACALRKNNKPIWGYRHENPPPKTRNFSVPLVLRTAHLKTRNLSHFFERLVMDFPSVLGRWVHIKFSHIYPKGFSARPQNERFFIQKLNRENNWKGTRLRNVQIALYHSTTAVKTHCYGEKGILLYFSSITVDLRNVVQGYNS